jgi:predicted phage baseplate assembly protein
MLSDEDAHKLVKGTEVIVLAGPIDWTKTQTPQTWQLRLADGMEGKVLATPQDFEMLPAAAEDPLLIEFVTLKPGPAESRTRLDLAAALKNAYDPTTVTIFANVAAATQGETVQEIVGGGDASQAHQQFALKQTPLTFTSADTSTGAQSSLELYVNGVQWTEVDSLYAQGPRRRVFVTRRDDDGTTRLTFGDGKFGALLPTGLENIQTRYRKGIGLTGLVKAGQLSLLMNRPLGVRAVTNPDASSGAQDPESLDNARRNAPLQTLTLGRVVSLRDYQDFARAFSGIAKAHAAWVWTRGGRGVFVTVALPGGAPPPQTDTTLGQLAKVLNDSGNPLVPLRVAAGTVTLFALAGNIVSEPDRIPDQVKADVDAALRAQFNFDAREFGQNVALSEVVALIQNVPGVQSLALTHLKFSTRPGTHDPLNPTLVAARAQPGAAMDATHPNPAEVLVLDENSLPDLKVKTA